MGLFKSIISGDGVSVPVKFQEPVLKTWTTTFCCSGNMMMQYHDDKNAIPKRTVLFEFRKKVPELNTDLLADIERDELPSIFLRCVRTYREACRRWKGQGFWEHVAGPFFDTMQRQTAASISTLDEFLDLGDEEVRVSYERDQYVSFKVFQRAYNGFLERNQHARSHVSDYLKLESRGYEVNKYNVCTRCHMPATRRHCTCVERGTRTKIQMIKHMRLSFRQGERWAVTPNAPEVDQLVVESQQLEREELEEKMKNRPVFPSGDESHHSPK
jgi:hypothetical protein